MTVAMDQVCKEALELPLDQRMELVHRILEQSEGSLDSEQARREWDGVIRERMARYDAGQSQSRPASDVFASLDKRLNG